MFYKKALTIKFANELPVGDLPQLSKKHIPDWYKSTPLFADGKSEQKTSELKDKTMKKCIPFLDSLTAGYMIELWCDIRVTKDANNALYIDWTYDIPPVERRRIEGTQLLPVPAGHLPDRLAWKVPFHIQTPSGYSALLLQPINRFDLPFTTLGGVVDTDSTMASGGIPFFIQSSFEGIIKRGTPIIQVIPFKRDNWCFEEDNEIKLTGQKNQQNSISVISGWYKQNIWKRKTYN